MGYTLEQFSADCHRALAADPGPDGRKKVCELVQKACTDADFVAKRDQIRDSVLQGKQQERFTLFVSNLVDEMTKSGKTEMVELTAAQKAEWRKVLDPVATEMESRVGKETIAEFRKEAGGSATH